MTDTLHRWRLVGVGVALAAALVGISSLRLQPVDAATVAAERDLAVVDPAEVGVDAKRLERLEAGMQAMVDDGKLAGVVTLLARHGKLVYSGVHGVENVETRDPMTRESIFRIFSMTKPIIGTAMMMLHEEGLWRLNDPVSRYIPEFANLRVYSGENPDGSAKLEELESPMRMRHLMTHTAGLGYVLNRRHPVNRMFIEQGVLDPDAPLQTMIDKMAEVPLLAQPGTRWSYSAAIDVQGSLIEKLSGQPLGEFLQERIFEPLGMVDTAFYVPPDKVDRFAFRHNVQDGELSLEGGPEPRTMPPAGPSGGGGLYGTADDYLRFAQMMLNGGELDGVRLLAPRTVEMMRTNHMSDQSLATRGPGQGWGLGFSVIMDAAAAGEPYGDGSYFWVGIAGTWFWIDPVNDLTFVGMIQHSGRALQEVQGLSRNLVYQAVVGDYRHGPWARGLLQEGEGRGAAARGGPPPAPGDVAVVTGSADCGAVDRAGEYDGAALGRERELDVGSRDRARQGNRPERPVIRAGKGLVVLPEEKLRRAAAGLEPDLRRPRAGDPAGRFRSREGPHAHDEQKGDTANPGDALGHREILRPATPAAARGRRRTRRDHPPG